MTANLLSLNLSKTEFMLVGLPQQLSKIQPITFPSFYPPILQSTSARILAFIFYYSLWFVTCGKTNIQAI